MYKVSPTKKPVKRSLEEFIQAKISSNFSAASALSIQNVCIELYDAYSLDEATPHTSFHNRSTAITAGSRPLGDFSRKDSKLVLRNQSYYLQDNLNQSIRELSRLRSRKQLRPLPSKQKSPYATSIEPHRRRGKSSRRGANSMQQVRARFHFSSVSPAKALHK